MMKKVIVTALFLILFSDAYAEATDNLGYNQTNGMVGIFASMPNFSQKSLKSADVSGGFFGYWNIVNSIYGNFSIGAIGSYELFKQNKSGLKSNINLQKVGVSFAYMTASDFVNAWIGVAGTYNLINNDIKSFTYYENNGASTDYGSLGKKTYDALGGDAFVGIEYLFTEDKKWGAFFEFRFSFLENIQQFSNTEFDSKLPLTRYSYSLGLSYHF